MNGTKVPANLTPDQGAAHQFLSELRTRISTQPLPYQYGVEARALESLWELFAHARTAMKDYPGCVEFARVATEMLNVHVRPVTAKWHRAHSEGRLNSRDGSNEFRAALEALRPRLREYAERLHQMAYGTVGADEGLRRRSGKPSSMRFSPTCPSVSPATNSSRIRPLSIRLRLPRSRRDGPNITALQPLA